MPFDTGRVTFFRYSVAGDAPAQGDATAIDTLNQFAFAETEIGTPDEVEAGFVTGLHVLDTAFSYDKNVFGANSEMLLFGLRIDTHKVPSEIKRAYKQMNEQMFAERSATGFLSRNEKREAKEFADRQMQDDLAAGKFRKTKLVPLLWDLSSKTLYCGGIGNAVNEQLVTAMRRAFAVELEPMTGGAVVANFARSKRDLEDAKPSAFTRPPAAVSDDDDEAVGPSSQIPEVPWASASYETRDFLGNEFLIWLWHSLESSNEIETERRVVSIVVDKTLDMECAWEVTGKISLRGSGPSQSVEAKDALSIGKWPRKLGLILHDGEHQFELTYQADRAIVSSLLLPNIEEAETPRELTEMRLSLVRDFTTTWDGVVARFAKDRFSDGWPTRRDSIKAWVRKGSSGR